MAFFCAVTFPLLYYYPNMHVAYISNMAMSIFRSFYLYKQAKPVKNEKFFFLLCIESHSYFMHLIVLISVGTLQLK